MTEFEKQLKELEHLIKSEAYHDYKTMITWFRSTKLASDIDETMLTNYVDLMMQLLHYKPNKEEAMVYGYTTAKHIRACAAGELERLISDNYTAKKITPKGTKQTLDILQPYFDYIINHESSWKQDWLIYRVFKYGHKIFHDAVETWVLGLEQSQLRPQGFLAGIKQALEFESLDVSEKPWSFAVQKLLPLLEHKHTMIRAIGAKKLGEYYSDADVMQVSTDISLHDMLILMADKERQNGQVSGGFIDGLGDGMYGLHCLTGQKDYGYDKQLQNIDVKRWALDVLKDLKYPEAPNVQSFEFHIHEFFDTDAEAVYEMIEMGNVDLALMTATETVCDEMKPVLEHLAQSNNADISGRAKEYLLREFG